MLLEFYFKNLHIKSCQNFGKIFPSLSLSINPSKSIQFCVFKPSKTVHPATLTKFICKVWKIRNQLRSAAHLKCYTIAFWHQPLSQRHVQRIISCSLFISSTRQQHSAKKIHTIGPFKETFCLRLHINEFNRYLCNRHNQYCASRECVVCTLCTQYTCHKSKQGLPIPWSFGTRTHINTWCT